MPSFFYGRVISFTPTLYADFFLFPFRKLSPKMLLIFGLVFMLISGLRDTLQIYDAKNVRVKGETAIALERKR